MHPVRQPRRRAALTAAGLLVALGVILGGMHSQTSTSDPESASGLMPGSAAMRATINPETGGVDIAPGLLPLAQESGALDPGTVQALRRDTDGLQEVFHPDGSVSVNLQGRFQNASVARLGKDGVMTICTEDLPAVKHALDTDAGSGASTLEVQ